MEPDHCTISTSNDFVDGPTSIKEEPVDDDPQSEEQLSYQHFKNERPIINIAPIVTSNDCVSNPGENQLTVKSEPYFNENATETSIETAVESEVDTNNNITSKLYEVRNKSLCPIHSAVKSEYFTKLTPKLYEVKNESPCPIHSTVKSEAVTKLTPKLYEVKNESPCPIHSAVKSEYFTKLTPKLYEVKNESPCPIHSTVKSEAVTKLTPKLYDVKNESPCPIHSAVKSESFTKLTPKINEVKNESPCPIHLTVKSEAATNITPKLYEVKNESPCSTHTKIVHNDIDAGSELVEVPGELDCKPEIIDNVNSVDVLGNVNMQTSVQHNDTVNHKPLLTSMNNCEVDLKETTALGK